jgi:hypothetical protein
MAVFTDILSALNNLRRGCCCKTRTLRFVIAVYLRLRTRRSRPTMNCEIDPPAFVSKRTDTTKSLKKCKSMRSYVPTTVNSLVAPPELKISCLFVNTTKHILFRFQRGRVNFSVGQDQIMICGQRGDVGVCLFKGHETIRRRRLKTL